MTLNPRLHRPGLRKLLGALIATTTALCASLAAAESRPDAAVRDVAADEAGYGGLLALPVGGSRILRFAQPIGRVMIGNAKVGDVIPLSDRTLYVMAKAAGATSLTAMPRGGVDQPLATLDLRVGYDVDGFKRAVQEVMPGERVEASARGDGLVLTGLLSSSAVAARAAALAESFAPQHVINLTRIRGAEQVMLSVRVAEVKRTALKQLGITNIEALWDSENLTAIAPGAFNSEAFASIIGRAKIGEFVSLQAFVDLLEQKGFASTLAEPKLVALSGETAVFFAGGEFPVPVPQDNGLGGTQIVIEWKQYGVSIGFTPTVYGDTINLLVSPEVSALDRENSVVLQGFRIPGITTRRAKTTVELRNGQSFAIAGLIRREFTNNLRGLPGVSDMPIFGQLFRSTAFNNAESEVVIIVTANLAKPTTRENLLVPTDLRRGPTEGELFLTNTTDVPVTPTAAPSPPRPAPQH